MGINGKQDLNGRSSKMKLKRNQKISAGVKMKEL